MSIRQQTVALLCAALFGSAIANADPSLKSALGLSMEQAHAVTAIERAHRPAYIAKRGEYTRNARWLRNAHAQNDAAKVAQLEPVVAALAVQLKQLRDAQDSAIRALLDAQQQIAFDAYLEQRRTMVGASRDERIFDNLP